MDIALVERAAFGIISRREHSAHDLQQKLSRRDFPAEAITQVIQKLQDLDLLNDCRFAQQFVRMHHRRFGDKRLRQSLRQHGISDDDIATALASDCTLSEYERARMVYEKKYGSGSEPLALKQKQQAMRFLHTRGFSSDTIQTILNTDDADLS